MRKIMFVGRSGCGKTTLSQALRGDKIEYHKTQYINHFDVIIDTPGEYAENRALGRALILYSYEAEVIGLLLSAIEPYSLYGPNIVAGATREVVGIVTQIDRENANPQLAEHWLRIAGCRRIFHVSAVTGEGLPEIFDHLKEPEDRLPWDKENM